MGIKIRDWGLVIAAGSLMMFMLYIGWTTLIDGTLYNPVLEFGYRFGNILPTDKQTYRPGEIVKIRMVIHKNRNITGKAYWRLIDSNITAFPCRDAPLPAGVHDNFMPVIKLPESTPSGEYYLAGITEYKVNWLRTVSYGIYSRKFTVVNGPKGSADKDIGSCPDYDVSREENK